MRCFKRILFPFTWFFRTFSCCESEAETVSRVPSLWIHPSCTFVSSFMPGKPNRNEAVLHDTSWIGREALEAISLFSSNGASEVPHLLVGREEDWEVNFPQVSYRICSKYPAHRIPMYEMVFKDMYFRLPFSPLFVAVLQWLELCPSQLHPRSFPYVKAFLKTCFSVSFLFEGGQKLGSP